ncbi:MAG: DUF1289 domain-containing protein [Pseudomonadota bacterium]
MTYPSPCVDVCRIDRATTWCRGCLRTVEEIRAWKAASPDERRAILDRVAARRREVAG